MVQNRSVLDIPVFHKIYDLYKLIHSLYPGIPKAQRYTLWQKCENTTLHLLELLIETSHFKDEKRMGHLHQMSHKLEQILRLSSFSNARTGLTHYNASSL